MSAESHPLRILVVTNYYQPEIHGGAEIVAERIARGMMRRGHDVAVMTGSSARNTDRLDIDDVNGIRIFRIRNNAMGLGSDYYSDYAGEMLARVLRAAQPDVVHFHNVRGLGVNLITVAREFGARTVVTLHDFWFQCCWATRVRVNGKVCTDPDECGVACIADFSDERLRGTPLPIRLRRDFMLHSLAAADELIAPSEFLAQAMLEGSHLQRDISVLSHGIDLERFPPGGRSGRDKKVRFVAASTIAEHKGIGDLLDAAEMLWQHIPLRGKWSLAIAGQGSLSAKVEADIRSGRFGDAVHYLGKLKREQISDLLSEADVAVLASRWPENEPLVLLEAIAAGKAQIGPALGGARNLIEHGVSGHLFCPGDAEALCNALATYARHPDMARAHGAFNERRRSQFEEAIQVCRLEQVFKKRRHASAEPHGTGSGRHVICVGSEPSREIFDLCARLYEVERVTSPVTLLWHERADENDWEEAAFCWAWNGSDGSESIRRAVALQVPVLAPSAWMGARARLVPDATRYYDTLLDAALALCTWTPRCDRASGRRASLANTRESTSLPQPFSPEPDARKHAQQMRPATLSPDLVDRFGFPSAQDKLLSPGERRSSENLESSLGSGWSRWEGWGVWSDGSEARILFAAREWNRGLVLRLKGRFYEPSLGGDCLVKAFLGEFEIPVRVSVLGRASHIDVTLPSGSLGLWTSPDGSAAAFDVKLAFPYAISPLEVGESSDERKLCFGLEELMVMPGVGGPHRPKGSDDLCEPELADLVSRSELRPLEFWRPIHAPG